MKRNPDHVYVYGGDHSPWVQAVLLGLYEKRIAHTVVTVPPLAVFLRSGVLMPAAKLDDGPWLLDSERILGEVGFSPVVEEDRSALQRVFGAGALERGESTWEFWYAWSHLRERHPKLARRLWNQVWRTFSVFYYWAVIKFARRMRPARTQEQIARSFAYWEERLGSGAPFLGGEAPDTADLQLCGLVQMFGSIPGPSLHVLRTDPKLPRLQSWASAMQRRFAGYDHLYTGPFLSPELASPTRSPRYERPFFWLGAALMWLGFPITLAAVVFFFRKIRRDGLQRA